VTGIQRDGQFLLIGLALGLGALLPGIAFSIRVADGVSRQGSRGIGSTFPHEIRSSQKPRTQFRPQAGARRQGKGAVNGTRLLVSASSRSATRRPASARSLPTRRSSETPVATSHRRGGRVGPKTIASSCSRTGLYGCRSIKQFAREFGTAHGQLACATLAAPFSGQHDSIVNRAACLISWPIKP
jgi:hypothetical protein